MVNVTLNFKNTEYANWRIQCYCLKAKLKFKSSKMNREKKCLNQIKNNTKRWAKANIWASAITIVWINLLMHMITWNPDAIAAYHMNVLQMPKLMDCWYSYFICHKLCVCMCVCVGASNLIYRNALLGNLPQTLILHQQQPVQISCSDEWNQNNSYPKNYGLSSFNFHWLKEWHSHKRNFINGERKTFIHISNSINCSHTLEYMYEMSKGIKQIIIHQEGETLKWKLP